jgi:hypothetical protein
MLITIKTHRIYELTATGLARICSITPWDTSKHQQNKSCNWNSPTVGGSSVGIVRLWTKSHGICFHLLFSACEQGSVSYIILYRNCLASAHDPIAICVHTRTHTHTHTYVLSTRILFAVWRESNRNSVLPVVSNRVGSYCHLHGATNKHTVITGSNKPTDWITNLMGQRLSWEADCCSFGQETDRLLWKPNIARPEQPLLY